MNAAELRRLMELAAKAHGDLLYIEDMDAWIHVDSDGNRGAWWRPNDDDGDSRRMEVALRVNIFIGADAVWVMAGHKVNICEGYTDDPCAATRLAVLRAAAAIGEAMP